MGITIKEINVQNLGPIRETSWKIGRVNLIYGDRCQVIGCFFETVIEFR